MLRKYPILWLLLGFLFSDRPRLVSLSSPIPCRSAFLDISILERKQPFSKEASALSIILFSSPCRTSRKVQFRTAAPRITTWRTRTAGMRPFRRLGQPAASPSLLSSSRKSICLRRLVSRAILEPSLAILHHCECSRSNSHSQHNANVLSFFLGVSWDSSSAWVHCRVSWWDGGVPAAMAQQLCSYIRNCLVGYVKHHR